MPNDFHVYKSSVVKRTLFRSGWIAINKKTNICVNFSNSTIDKPLCWNNSEIVVAKSN